mgnify:FL=1
MSFLAELPQDPNFLYYLAAAPFAALAAYFVLPFLANTALLKYPGPVSAKFSRLYLAKQSRNGVRSMAVHKEHLKHGQSASRWLLGRVELTAFGVGTFVRIGPNESAYMSRDPAFCGF